MCRQDRLYKDYTSNSIPTSSCKTYTCTYMNIFPHPNQPMLAEREYSLVWLYTGCTAMSNLHNSTCGKCGISSPSRRQIILLVWFPAFCSLGVTITVHSFHIDIGNWNTCHSNCTWPLSLSEHVCVCVSVHEYYGTCTMAFSQTESMTLLELMVQPIYIAL